jgi:amidase
MRTPVRRSLALATAALLALGVVGGAAPGVGAAGRPPTDTRVAGIDVDATTIPQLEALMNAHRLNAVQLVTFYLHRIRTLQPKLHAVIKVSPTALADARRADAQRRAGDRRPLLGIPVLVKDNVDTSGMPTTAGSWALAGSSPGDAFIIQRLKAAGAYVIAKANLSEWANFRSGPSSSGWSGIGGQTNMPYVLDRNPCGSSSGTGVGVAADLATVGIGTETDGSVVCPSGANGIVGIKPTLGLWSRAGVVPISAEQDTAGPMARNVTDAAALLGALTGVDPHDAATAAQAGHAFSDYTQFLDSHALEGARIGVWRETTYTDTTAPVVEPILADAIDTLEAQGATVVDNTDIDLTAAFTNEFPALLCEFKSDIASYLGTYTAAGYPKTLAELIAFDEAHPELEGPWNDLVFQLAEETNGRDADCADLREATTPPTQAAIDDLMAANDLDAIIALTNGPAWPTSDDPTLGDLNGQFATYFVGSSTASAVSGYGTITVPAAYASGLPVGISFIGGRWSEPELVGFAYDFEQATHARVKPTYIPTIGDALFPGVPSSEPAIVQQRTSVSDRRQQAVPSRSGLWRMPSLR